MFHLFAKIREVDGALTPGSRVFECHPEAAFRAMNGDTPLEEPKKLRNRLHSAGLEKRKALLVMHGFCKSLCTKRGFPGRRPVATTFWMPVPAPGPRPAFFATRRSAFQPSSPSMQRAFAWRFSYSGLR